MSTPSTTTGDGAATRLQDQPPFAGYSQRPRPLAEYGVLVAAFATAFSVITAAARRQGRLPERVDAGDIVLGGIASHKLARLITKDKVTSVVRAPFTEEEGGGSGAEVEEKPRGTGVRYAIGELISCPHCLGQWIAAAFIQGLVFAPRVTRLVASMFSVVALSDFLQIAYKAAENRKSAD
jgi:Protein of unknown function (DUF1360)